MSDQPALFTSHPTQAGTKYVYHHELARTSDPVTSHKAARRAARRSGSQRMRLLADYGTIGPMTAYEAGRSTGLIDKPGCAYWRRVTELLHEGLIQDTGTTRLVATGEHQRVCAITAKGIATLIEALG